MLKEKFFCGIAIGSKKIKGAVIKVVEKNKTELISFCEKEIHGFKDFCVSDLNEFSECIAEITADLCKKNHVKIKNVQLGLGGNLIRTCESSAVISLIDKGSKIITENDIKNVNKQCNLLSIKIEEELLHNIPQYYVVDDAATAINPLGLYGRKLAVYSLCAITDVNHFMNITKAVNQAGFDVENIFFNSYVSAQIALGEKEKIDGCVLIDVGSKETNILIFKDNILRFIDKITIGGDNFTSVIAKELNVPFNCAEELKISYAEALGTDYKKNEEILIKREDNQYTPIKRELIFHAISSTVENLVKDIRNSIKISGLNDKINGDITMIGGGSLLPGLIECIEKETNKKVKLGKNKIHTNNVILNEGKFIGAIGLAYQGYQKKYLKRIEIEKPEDFMKLVTNKIKNLYNEYF